MARAAVIGIKSNFGAPVVADDASNGWQATFQVVFSGEGAANGGFDLTDVVVHFGDADTGLQMDNKIRDAVRAEGVRVNIPGAATMTVISGWLPRRL
jgi:hypothetical protein